MPLLLLVASLTGCASSQTANRQQEKAATNSPPPQPYMRVTHPNADTVALQIALRKFTPAKGRAGPTVWLSGASHIGETNYFKTLQKHLDSQALVLFEGVGARSKKMKFDPEEETSIQHTLATSLGLVFQLTAIDYDRPQFRNSDLTLAQLQTLLAGTATKTAPGAGANAGQEFQELLEIMDGSSLFGALLHMGIKFVGSSPKLRAMTKLMLIETLGELRGDLGQVKGLPPEIQRLLAVIIQERNNVVLGDLKAALQTGTPPRSIAIFYGAAHMADLEKRLTGELNYRPRENLWLTAMSVNTGQAGLSAAELESLRSLIKWQLEALQP